MKNWGCDVIYNSFNRLSNLVTATTQDALLGVCVEKSNDPGGGSDE